jgi:Zn-dependent M28 family amino/carboxypeptidase
MVVVSLAAALLLVALAVAAVTQPALPSAVAGRSPRAQAERLRDSVELLATTLQPRDFAHPEGLERAAAYIAEELRKAGGRVREQTFEVQGSAYKNVIALFGPETAERVVVGAHYDTEGARPGADDNASGVAGLLELARLLGEQPPAATVELVAYSLEEPPNFRTEHMGSHVHAASLAAAEVRVRAMLALEMIGYFSDTPHSQQFPLGVLGWLYPTTGNFITVVGKLGQGRLVRGVKRAMQSAGDLPVRSINAPAMVTGIDFSDHRSFWQQGYPAVMITDTSFYRNPNYHTDQDLPVTLDYGRMAQVVDGVDCAVRALGETR